MKYLLIAILTTLSVYANDVDFPEFSQLDADGKVEYFWSQHLSHQLDPIHFQSNLAHLKELSITNQLRVRTILDELGYKNAPLMEVNELSEKDALKMASEWLYLGKMNVSLSAKAKKQVSKASNYIKSLQNFRVKSEDEIYDLVHNSPDLSTYNGDYLVKLFMFCRHDRNYPCRFILKDRHDQLVRNADGTLWSLPSLAQSARGLPYYITNGYTPSGVHTMDSVMPAANRQDAFGKFRRVILNWMPKGRTRELLPNSALNKKWWKEASLARDNDRKYLRIHGTGRTANRARTYFPHVPTSGCISTREGKYDSVVYKDQRKILDALMKAQDLLPSYQNETSIKGVLYVIELDDKKEKVTLKTLEQFGIK